MAQFEVNGIKYQSSRLRTMEQMHVLRRLAPLLTAFKDLLGPGGQGLKFASVADAFTAMDPILRALANLSDDEFETIVGICAGKVQTFRDNAWSAIWVPSVKGVAYSDIGAVELTRIVGFVVMDLFANVMGTLTTGGPANDAPTVGPLAVAPAAGPKLGDRDEKGRVWTDNGGMHSPRWLWPEKAA